MRKSGELSDQDELREQVKTALDWYEAENLKDDNHTAVEDGFISRLMSAIALHKQAWELEARLRGTIDFITWVVQHDQSSFRSDRAWFKIKPSLLLQYEAEVTERLAQLNQVTKTKGDV